ncbi:MAG: RNA polymerase sigma factor [Nannocystales bacterium]
MQGDPSEVICRARAGDRAAFDELASAHTRKLRAVIRRMVGHPQDTDDLVQDTLLRAFEKLGDFRGDAKFGTWLCTIGARLSLDYLRTRKRWRLRAQAIAEHQCRTDPKVFEDFTRAMSGPDDAFDVHEHIAFCFTCVARTLSPQETAALMLRDAIDHSTREAAAALGVSSSVLRHTLARARAHMQDKFEGLCTLVNKQGACWQCESLRDSAPPAKRGPVLPVLSVSGNPHNQYQRRLQIVRAADTDQGRTQALHDFSWRMLERNERLRLEPTDGSEHSSD